MQRHYRWLSVVASAALLACASPAFATIVTVFNEPSTGAANFNATVTAAGGTANSQLLVLGQTVYADFTVSKAPVTTYGTLSGPVMDIGPSGPGTIPRADPNDYRASGMTFIFNNPINSIGFEVGDWGTCCQPSSLYIAFDGGTGIKVGQSSVSGDVFFNGLAEVFVGAFDDTGQFTTVTFWGDGVGEVLYNGGTIRYALLDQGSLPGGIPEPATWAMMIGGLGITGAALRSRRRLLAAT